jgi:hypothetical protein
MKQVQSIPSSTIHIGVTFGRLVLVLLNPCAKLFQLIIMRKHRTNEVITDTVLRFHPLDARPTISHLFIETLKKYHIPLDSHFFRVLR